MEPWSRYAAGHEPINFALIIIQYCAKSFMLLLPFYNHLQPVQFITGGDIDTYIDTVVLKPRSRVQNQLKSVEEIQKEHCCQ